MESRPALVARGLAIGYRRRRDRVVSSGLELELARGRLVCLLGPNGAGKSTLLRTLAGVQAPLAGDIELAGRPIDAWSARDRARELAVVLTDGSPPLAMTGEELVRLGRHPYTPWSGKLSGEDLAAVACAIEAVDGVDLASRALGRLSDGERQKLLVARALAQESSVLLLDEITAFLDVPRRLDIFRILRRLAHDHDKAVLLTTHDLDLALRSADRVWLLSAEGLKTGSPESLVLDGSLSRAFARRGVRFDAASGSFHLETRTRRPIALDGEGLAAEWTRRGLERLGFEVARGDGAAPGLDLVRVEGGDEARWRLEAADGGVRRFEHLDPLFDAVAPRPRQNLGSGDWSSGDRSFEDRGSGDLG